MSNKKLKKVLINSFVILPFLIMVFLLLIRIDAQTFPKKRSLDDSLEDSGREEKLLTKMVSVYTDLALLKRYSDLERFVASEADYKQESDLMREPERKTMDNKFPQSSKSNATTDQEKRLPTVDFDLTPLLLLKRHFVLTEFPKSIYEMKMFVSKIKTISIDKNKAIVRAFMGHDITVSKYDFYFIRSQKREWKIYYIKNVIDSNERKENNEMLNSNTLSTY